MEYVTSVQKVALRGDVAGHVQLTLYVDRASYSNCHTGVAQVRDSETLAK